MAKKIDIATLAQDAYDGLTQRLAFCEALAEEPRVVHRYQQVIHVYKFKDGRVVRMIFEEDPAPIG